MKPPRKSFFEERAAAKAESGRRDRERLENGEDPEVIQRENSIFPRAFFKNGRFLNLASVVGK